MSDARATAYKYLLFVVMGFLVVGVCGASFYRCSYEKRIAKLQNDMAEKDKTIEIQKGLYTRLTVQTEGIKDTLDKKDEQVKSLLDQVKKQKQELLTATSVVVQWKKAYESLATATQTTVPADPMKLPKDGEATVNREKVDFHKDFGYLNVDGWTLTNPPQAWIRVSQGRPLKITLALSQDKEKKWHTYATSSEENIGVDISVTSVNPHMLSPKWYENIGIVTGLGVGTNQSGLGALFSVGLNYRIKQFSIGPQVWLGLNDVVDKYYGVNFEYRPFQRN